MKENETLLRKQQWTAKGSPVNLRKEESLKKMKSIQIETMFILNMPENPHRPYIIYNKRHNHLCTIQCPFLYLHIFWVERINKCALSPSKWTRKSNFLLTLKSLLGDRAPKLNTLSGNLTSPWTILVSLDRFNSPESSDSLLDAKQKVSESESTGQSVVSNSLLPRWL